MQKYSSGRCKFQSECAYSHQNIPNTKEKCELTEKVEILEKIVWEITLKLIKVDQVLKNIKEQVKLQDPTVYTEDDQEKENENHVEKHPSESETHDKSSALEEEFTENYKTKEPELCEVEIKAVNANAK
jgi:hypothetical protein